MSYRNAIKSDLPKQREAFSIFLFHLMISLAPRS